MTASALVFLGFLACGCSQRVTRVAYKIPDNSISKHDFESGTDHEEWRDDNPTIVMHKLTGGLVSGPCGIFWAQKEYRIELASERNEYTINDIHLFDVAGDDKRRPLDLERGRILTHVDDKGGTLLIEILSKDRTFRVHTTFHVKNDSHAGYYFKHFYEYGE